jgi:hypothetical protein
MINSKINKILAKGIFVLFVGVGIHPAFTSSVKTFTESLTIDLAFAFCGLFPDYP